MKLKILSITVISILMACSSETEDSSTGAFPIAEPMISDMVGVWDASQNDPDFGLDELYFSIGTDGTITNYDYLGDEFDDSEDCYYVGESQTLQEVGAGQYYIEYDEPSFNYYSKTTIQFSMPNENALEVTMLHDMGTEEFYLDDEVISADWEVTYDTDSTASFTFEYGGVTTQLTLTQSASMEMWEISSGDIAESHQNIIDEWEIDWLMSSQVTFTHSKSNKTESSMTPICSDNKPEDRAKGQHFRKIKPSKIF